MLYFATIEHIDNRLTGRAYLGSHKQSWWFNVIN